MDYLEGILHTLPSHPSYFPGTDPAYLKWFISKIRNEFEVIPLDKLGRWVGFIQGVMSARGWISVQEERDRTRPIFTKAIEKI